MLNYLIKKGNQLRAETIVGRIEQYIKNAKKLIDIGSGTGYVTHILREKGKDITPIDVGSFRGPRLVEPLIYNGITLPFSKNSFDTALLLMVFHHMPNPSVIFSEAARVAKELVVIETSYKNKIGKFFTVIADTVANIQFKINWKSYKTDKEWGDFFRKRGFKIVNTHYFNDWTLGVPFLHILYFLKRNEKYFN